MTDIWLPGYQRMPIAGQPGGTYATTSNPKLLWHTTEGGSVAGAVQAYRPYPPHLIVNPATGEKIQHIPLNRSAYASSDLADQSYVIQVEVVGYAAQSHAWDEGRLRWLAEHLVNPVHEAMRVPDTFTQFYGQDAGFTLAVRSSPIRMTLAGLNGFSGHLGHQHLPGDDHWDPGKINIQKILDLAVSMRGDSVMANMSNEDQDRVKYAMIDAMSDPRVAKALAAAFASAIREVRYGDRLDTDGDGKPDRNQADIEVQALREQTVETDLARKAAR